MDYKSTNDRSLFTSLMPEGDPAKRTQECLLVLGMHRSGTSVITRVASLMGANLPVHIMEAGLGNETGHWESQVLVDYHDGLLAELGSRWDDWRPLEFERLTALRLEEIRSEIWRVVVGEYGAKSPIVIKDPRICRFAHLFISLLDDNGIFTRVLIPFRNPLEVIHSLQARDEMHRVDAAFLWLRHILDAENASREHSRSFVNYSDLLESWRVCWARVSDDMEVVWPTQLEQVEDQIEKLINPKQRHHQHGDDELMLDPLLKQWIATAYKCLLELQKSPNSSSAKESLDTISHQITAASPTLFQAISQIRRSYKEKIAEQRQSLTLQAQEIALRDQIIANRDRVIADRDKRIAHIYGSFSWRVTKPLRELKRRLDSLLEINHKHKELKFINDHAAKDAEPDAGLYAKTAVETTVFFTICARNFMAFAKTLFLSLQRFYPDIKFYVALCDELGEPFDPSGEPFPFVYLDDLSLPDWRAMSQRYNITEFNTSIKPFVFKYLFETLHAQNVVYMDPDIYVTNRLHELERALAYKKSAVLTPHMLEPAEKAEMNEKRLLQYGIYNLGFLALRNTPEVRNIVEWWGRRLVTECVIDRQEGLFVDQKWADHFPAFLEDVHVLRHPGYNVAYWNLSSRKVKWNGKQWMVNGEPLRFVHFSGSKLDDPDVFSRHSSEHTPKTIGQLKNLLEEYRETIFSNRHQHYRTIPYAFSWSGEKGVNEHTPRPDNSHSRNLSRFDSIRGISTIKRTVWPLWANARQVYNKEGLKGIKLRVRRRLINSVAEPHHQLAFSAIRCVNDQYQSFKKKVLFVEHTTPKPDQDAGSLAAVNILQAFSLLGYSITFLPLDLSYDDKNSRLLENFGINCLHLGNIQSIGDHLRKEGQRYDFLFLNRGPVVAPYLDTFKRNCLNAIILLNTVDLHYLREQREAELEDSAKKLASALRTKAKELDSIGTADISIVLSRYEKLELEKEALLGDIRVLPLIFSEIDPHPPGFTQRKDILFIGSFPHLPNVDAALFFAREVFPKLHALRPDMIWHIVGSQPNEDILRLGEIPGIVVHGYVENLEPLFRTVKLSVVPLRYGAGIKGKIATSLSFGVPVVASPLAVEGTLLRNKTHVLIADTVDDYIDKIIDIYENEKKWNIMSAEGQNFVIENYSLVSNMFLLGRLMDDIDENRRPIDVVESSSKREFDLIKATFPDRFADREKSERSLIPVDGCAAFDINGFCAVCGQPGVFSTSFTLSDEHQSNGIKIPNWREQLACRRCGLTMRFRGALHLIYNRICLKPDTSIYLTEQVTTLYKLLKSRHPKLVGSEYLGDGIPLGKVKNGLRNENMEKLTFDDNTFDCILSFDVLEHVKDDFAAFKECYRCLKSGGLLFFSAPFAYDKEEKVIRARVLPDGKIEHLLEPEYHGNPVDPNNASLCYRYFAWDVLKDLDLVGFKGTKILHYWSRDFAYLGKFGFFISARKP